MDMENGKSEKHSWMIGKQFGRLTVESVFSNGKRSVCACLCSCGNRKNVRLDHILSGKVVSCRCYHREVTGNINKSHGMKNTRIYRIWQNMHSRCENENFTGYELWGGRGISVCEEWKHFEPFYEWAMANGYRSDLTIERVDNNDNYCPENCRWATKKEQALNRRSNVYITFNGVTKHISKWDEDIGSAKSGRVRARLNAGWSVGDAVTVKVWERLSGQRRL